MRAGRHDGRATCCDHLGGCRTSRSAAGCSWIDTGIFFAITIKPGRLPRAADSMAGHSPPGQQPVTAPDRPVRACWSSASICGCGPSQDDPTDPNGSATARCLTRLGLLLDNLASVRLVLGVGVSRSACWSYVTWYNELTGNWATWEPGEPVQPGAIGFFDEHRRFIHHRTLADLGIKPRIRLRDRPGSMLAWSESDVHFAIKVAGQSPAGFEALGTAEAGLRFTADREHACVLHMRDLTEAWIDDREQILQRIKGLLLAGQWDVDAVLVFRRLEPGFRS